VQAALTNTATPNEVKTDAQVDKDRISRATLDALLSLYKRAAAGNDSAGTKKWLTQLNLIAPMSPQAIKARAIDKSLMASTTRVAK